MSSKNEKDNQHSFSYWKNTVQLFQTIFPFTLYLIAFGLQQSITLSYLSKKHPKHQLDILNAIGLSNIYINCTVVPILYGLLAGISSLASNAYGAKDYYLMGLYVHRGRIVGLSFILISGIINFFFGHKILAIFVHDPKLVEFIGIYIKCQMIVQLLDGFYDVNVRYISILEKGHINLMICVPNCLLHFLWCHIYINVLDLGIFGAGLSLITTQFLNLLFSSLYIHIANPCPESYFCVNKDCFIGLLSYLKYTSSELAILISEMWSFELIGLVAFFISKVDFAAFILVMNISYNIWLINYGFHNGITIIIGTLITETTNQIVKRSILFFFVTANLLVSVILIICGLFAQKLILLFISDTVNPELNKLSLHCFYIILTVYFIDLNQSILTGIIRAFGRQIFIIVVMLITFYPLLITLAVILGRLIKLGSIGIFISLIIAYFTGLVIYIIYCIRLKFNQVRIEIEERIYFDKEVLKTNEINKSI